MSSGHFFAALFLLFAFLLSMVFADSTAKALEDPAVLYRLVEVRLH